MVELRCLVEDKASPRGLVASRHLPLHKATGCFVQATLALSGLHIAGWIGRSWCCFCRYCCW